MDISLIGSTLIEQGHKIFAADKTAVPFTQDDRIDSFLSDIESLPHAFVFGCILDRQVKAELAWTAPFRHSERIGDFAFETLERLSEADFYRLMTEPEPPHRFPKEMARNLHDAVRTIRTSYSGNAARIWEGKPSSAIVVYRFLQFRGVGLKIATMATNSLARELKVPFSDYYSVDISTDVHVRRVFTRLGLVREGVSNEELI